MPRCAHTQHCVHTHTSPAFGGPRPYQQSIGPAPAAPATVGGGPLTTNNTDIARAAADSVNAAFAQAGALPGTPTGSVMGGGPAGGGYPGVTMAIVGGSGPNSGSFAATGGTPGAVGANGVGAPVAGGGGVVQQAPLGKGGKKRRGKPAPGEGRQRSRILKIARGELGVKESSENNSKRIAKYRAAFGTGPGPWCAYFTSWALNKAGVQFGPNGTGSPAVQEIYSWAKSNNRFKSRKPKAGDLIFLRDNGHIGIVEKVDSNGTVHTIEGNTSNRVARRSYEKGSSTIVGYLDSV